MFQKSSSIYKAMAGLLVLDVALLVISGIPAIKDADHGFKQVVGAISWGGFLVVSATVISLAVLTLVRRHGIRRAAA